jgi:hypothetical protein
VLDAFRRYSVVAIGETHSNEQEHAFFRALIATDAAVSAGIDLVVEFGNARYQPVADRFVNGESVDAASLRRIWQNTTIPGVTWDVPVYEAFYREARNVNASLPPHLRIRVLLGDPAVDWDRADRGGWIPASTGRLGWPTDDERYERDFHVATVVRREVLTRKRQALVIQGAHHVYPTNTGSLVATLEARFGVERSAATLNMSRCAAHPSAYGCVLARPCRTSLTRARLRSVASARFSDEAFGPMRHASIRSLYPSACPCPVTSGSPVPRRRDCHGHNRN